MSSRIVLNITGSDNISDIIYESKNLTINNIDTNVYTAPEPAPEPAPSLVYEASGSWAIMKITGNYGLISGESFTDAIAANGYTDASYLKIIGIGNGATWNDFKFDYVSSSNGGKPEYLHIENISLVTTTIDYYAVYSRDTKTTMKDVNISGYSGLSGETGGGALRIRAADYSVENPPHSASNPTLSNVTVNNTCRGIRIQDSNSVYVKDCSVNNVTDNGIYFAAGSYNSATGCINCTIDNCTVITAGQCAFLNIGGSNNKFINCDMSGSRGAALGVWNTNGLIEVSNCTFTNANTAEVKTPWGGNTDDFGGAAVGFNVLIGDVSGYSLIKNCIFNSGAGSVYWKGESGSSGTSSGVMEVSNNTVNLANFPDGLVGAGSYQIIGAPDITKPTIILNPTDVSFEASLIPYNDNSYNSSDDISSNLFLLSQLTIDVCSNVISNVVGTYSVVITVTDPCGNDASATRIVNVIDTTPPVLTLIGQAIDTVIVNNVYSDLGVTANDIVDGDLSSSITVVSDLCTNILGSYIITYSISDICGNSSSITRTVNVIDNIDPTITLNPTTITIEASETAYIDDNTGDVISDNYFSFSELTIDVCSNVVSDVVGTYSVVYTVTDPCGNNASSTRIVNVLDTTAPVITISGDNPLYLIQNDTYVEFSANAIDIVDGNVNVDICLGLLDTSVEGTYEIIYSTTDNCGNDASAVRIVIVTASTPDISQNLLLNPALIDYQIPKYYEMTSNGTIAFPITNPVSLIYKAYCVPTSFANVLNYYNTSLSLQSKYTSSNSAPPLTDFLYNYTGRPMGIIGVSDINKIDLGYMFNTNGEGFDLSNGGYTGTYLTDFPKFVNFMNIVSPTAQYRYYNKGFGYDFSYAHSSVSGETLTPIKYNTNDISSVFTDIKSDISNNRPVILSFTQWNIVYNTLHSVSGKPIYLYDFSGQVNSTLDIQSENPIYSNAEYIEEYWQVGEGLGHTVVCVGFIENKDGKDWVIVQDNINNSALLDSNPNKTPVYVGVPLDPSYLAMVTTIDFSPQDGTPVTNLQCLMQNGAVNIVSSGGDKYVFNGQLTYDSTIQYGLYNGTYTITGVPSSHPIAFLNNDVSNVLSYTGTTLQNKTSFTNLDDIYVKLNGNLGSNSYDFYSDSGLSNQIINFKLKIGKQYTFIATSDFQSAGHPFELNNNSSYKLTTNGSSFNFTVPNTTSIPWRCTAHSSMNGTIPAVSLESGDTYNEDFYYGDITLTVSGDFGTVSAYCYYHEYMGAENKFTYSNICNVNANITLSTNISLYNPSDEYNTLPQGYTSCIRLGNITDICSNYIVNNINSVELDPNNIGIFIQNDQVILQSNSALSTFSAIESLLFKIYDEQIQLMTPLQDMDLVLSNDKYTLKNSSEPQLTYFFITAKTPIGSADNDPEYYNLGPGQVVIGNLVRL